VARSMRLDTDERVDVKARVELVEDAIRGLMIASCRVSLRFASPPERSTFMDAPGSPARCPAQRPPLRDGRKWTWFGFLDAARRDQRLGERRSERYPGYLDRVLEREEEASLRPCKSARLSSSTPSSVTLPL